LDAFVRCAGTHKPHLATPAVAFRLLGLLQAPECVA
jgi:hypothetical protein